MAESLIDLVTLFFQLTLGAAALVAIGWSRGQNGSVCPDLSLLWPILMGRR